MTCDVSHPSASGLPIKPIVVAGLLLAACGYVVVCVSGLKAAVMGRDSVVNQTQPPRDQQAVIAPTPQPGNAADSASTQQSAGHAGTRSNAARSTGATSDLSAGVSPSESTYRAMPAGVQPVTAHYSVLDHQKRPLFEPVTSGHTSELREISVLPVAIRQSSQTAEDSGPGPAWSVLPSEMYSDVSASQPEPNTEGLTTGRRQTAQVTSTAMNSSGMHSTNRNSGPPGDHSKTELTPQTGGSGYAFSQTPSNGADQPADPPTMVSGHSFLMTDTLPPDRSERRSGHQFEIQVPPASAVQLPTQPPTQPLTQPLTNSRPPSFSQPPFHRQPGISAAASSDLMWWETELTAPILEKRPSFPLTLEQTLGLALMEAPELQVLHADWYIRQAEVDRVDAAFDWTTFVESIWNRDSTPVGSDLDGAAQRLRSRALASSGGIRRRTRSGAELELSQSFGLQSSNSRFINPNHQGNSRLAFELEQPLLQGSGEEFNTSPVRLAELEKDSAFDRFQIGVQDHLLEVASAYWRLVLVRGQYCQAVRSSERVSSIADEMATRVEIDVTPNMLDRARSEVASQLAQAIDAEHEIIRAQDSLLRLIYGSRFTDYADHEILTQTLPMKRVGELEPEAQIERALVERSEIHQAIREIKSASIQMDVAASQVLPVLNMVLTGYVAGLRGNNDIGGSFVNQFRQGEPGVGIGFNFEIPYRNRAAQAAAEQAQIAIRRMQAQFEATVSLVTEDVRSQVIQRNKYGAVLDQQRDALERTRRILDHTATRRAVLADGADVADLYLENLLQMQRRLADAEFTVLQSQVRYSLADNALLRAVSQLDTLAPTTDIATMETTTLSEATLSDTELTSTAAPPEVWHLPGHDYSGGHSLGKSSRDSFAGSLSEQSLPTR
ncbi:MAG: TolC family protein [Fuerstiella sp.]